MSRFFRHEPIRVDWRKLGRDGAVAVVITAAVAVTSGTPAPGHLRCAESITLGHSTAHPAI